ncbi:ARM repeat-containing protein [Neoconidiobolus thromboides FSU 785]|nr:ARM repeat-containing protein [Neoconidiobolus thromboides FSU 785]
MNIEELLSNTLSGNAELRATAERCLQEKEQLDYQGFIVELIYVLRDDEKQPFIRQAAGLLLKNTIRPKFNAATGSESTKWNELQQAVKDDTKQELYGIIDEPNEKVALSISQVFSTIAAIELPNNEWPDLIEMLCNAALDNNDQANLNAIRTLGYVCQGANCTFLAHQSSRILAALLTVLDPAGAKKIEIRIETIRALLNSLEFLNPNIRETGERNYIMNVIDQNIRIPNDTLQALIFELLTEITVRHYDYMNSYFSGGYLMVAVDGLKHPDEMVLRQVIEFWSNLAMLEAERNETNSNLEEGQMMLPYYHFVQDYATYVIVAILQIMSSQEEDVDMEEENPPRSATNCLESIAKNLGNNIIPFVVPFVTQNLQNPDWRLRDTATVAFGTVVANADQDQIKGMADEGLQFFVALMDDSNSIVKDSAAFTLSRICEFLPDIINSPEKLQPLLQALFKGINAPQRIVQNCCWGLINLTKSFMHSDDPAKVDGFKSYIEPMLKQLVAATEGMYSNTEARASIYEAISDIVYACPDELLGLIEEVVLTTVQRLEATIHMASEVVNQGDLDNLTNLQMSLCNVLNTSINRLESRIYPVQDQIMQLLLRMFDGTQNINSAEDILTCIGAMVNALDKNIQVYIEQLGQILLKGTNHIQEPRVCCKCIAIVGDIVRSLREDSMAFVDIFIPNLGNLLGNVEVHISIQCAILSTLGDCASAIGSYYEKYLGSTMEITLPFINEIKNQLQYIRDQELVLEQYETILSCYTGIVEAFCNTQSFHLIESYIPQIFETIGLVTNIKNVSSEMYISIATILGDFADISISLGRNLQMYYRQDWIKQFLKNARSKNNPEGTRKLAKWAKSRIAQLPQQ